jgi:hypothetical protein
MPPAVDCARLTCTATNHHHPLIAALFSSRCECAEVRACSCVRVGVRTWGSTLAFVFSFYSPKTKGRGGAGWGVHARTQSNDGAQKIYDWVVARLALHTIARVLSHRGAQFAWHTRAQSVIWVCQKVAKYSLLTRGEIWQACRASFLHGRALQTWLCMNTGVCGGRQWLQKDCQH